MDHQNNQESDMPCPSSSVPLQHSSLRPANQNKNIKNTENTDALEQQSQFLYLNPEIKEKLDKIDKMKQQGNNKQNKQETIEDKIMYPKSNSKNGEKSEREIKSQFISKLKSWTKEKNDLHRKKQQIQLQKVKSKEQRQLRKLQQDEEQRQFLRLQKQKQIQQKIQQIEDRRRKRQESLKNAILKRSYQRMPTYLEVEQKYQEREREEQANMKLIKNKNGQGISIQDLKNHERAYIQRIKERLNMVSKTQSKPKSDFNLYLKRNSQKKEEQLNKIVKMKKYQQKINQIPIKIDSKRQQEKLIMIDKIKNPQKYTLLQKSLTDQQIYEEFQNYIPNIDRKEIGINYLKELQLAHPNFKKKRSQSEALMMTDRMNPETRLPKIRRSEEMPKKKEKLQPSNSYQLGLQRIKQKDNIYMKALKQKLELFD